MANDTSFASGMSGTLIVLLLLTTFVAVAGGIYVTGAGDDVVKYVMEKYFKAEAKAEEKALEKAGATKAEGFLYDQFTRLQKSDEFAQLLMTLV